MHLSVCFQRISNLEAQLASVKAELRRARTQHKQQLAEMAVDREEEKQKAFLDNEASLTRLRSEMERVHGELERSHQREKDAAQEKVRRGKKLDLLSYSLIIQLHSALPLWIKYI